MLNYALMLLFCRGWGCFLGLSGNIVWLALGNSSCPLIHRSHKWHLSNIKTEKSHFDRTTSLNNFAENQKNVLSSEGFVISITLGALLMLVDVRVCFSHSFLFLAHFHIPTACISMVPRLVKNWASIPWLGKRQPYYWALEFAKETVWNAGLFMEDSLCTRHGVRFFTAFVPFNPSDNPYYSIF